jgi:hypothetical protein
LRTAIAVQPDVFKIKGESFQLLLATVL